MLSTDLRADCARCAALCCVALAFDRSSLFALDKAAGEPCANLGRQGRCAIHAERAVKGFAGCESYECLGAGQAVTQGLFGGKSWQEDPALLGPMMRAFAVLRPAHEVLDLLRLVAQLPLPEAVLPRLAEARRGLEPEAGWTRSDVADGRIEQATEAARGFLRSLGPLLDQVSSERTLARSTSIGARPLSVLKCQ